MLISTYCLSLFTSDPATILAVIQPSVTKKHECLRFSLDPRVWPPTNKIHITHIWRIDVTHRVYTYVHRPAFSVRIIITITWIRQNISKTDQLGTNKLFRCHREFSTVEGTKYYWTFEPLLLMFCILRRIPSSQRVRHREVLL